MVKFVGGGAGVLSGWHHATGMLLAPAMHDGSFVTSWLQPPGLFKAGGGSLSQLVLKPYSEL